MKKIYLSILLLFVFLANTFTVSLPEKLEFLGFSLDNKWAFFRGIKPENSISPLSYFLYDTKKRVIHAEFKNPSGLVIWNRYYNPSQIEQGIETRSYQGYSVTLETQTEILGERQSGVSGNTENIPQNRKLYVRKCIFNLEYHRYNVYKRIRLFEYNISLIKKMQELLQ